jgi:hypothetical protein
MCKAGRRRSPNEGGVTFKAEGETTVPKKRRHNYMDSLLPDLPNRLLATCVQLVV